MAMDEKEWWCAADSTRATEVSAWLVKKIVFVTAPYCCPLRLHTFLAGANLAPPHLRHRTALARPAHRRIIPYLPL